MFNLFTLGFVTVLLLTGYLYWSINRRILGEQAKKSSRDFHVKPMDVSTLRPTVERVRNSPVLQLHNQPLRSSRRSRLITHARELVATLAFFRRHGDEHANRNN